MLDDNVRFWYAIIINWRVSGQARNAFIDHCFHVLKSVNNIMLFYSHFTNCINMLYGYARE